MTANHANNRGSRRLLTKSILIAASFFASITGSAFAEGPPSPYDTNESGAFIGGHTFFGQSRATGASNPGVGWLVGAEAGYIAARQAWNRLELSFEAGLGSASFKNNDKRQVDLDITTYGLAKFGYAYSIGNSNFGVFRAGAGPVFASYPQSAIVGATAGESITGFGGLLGFDMVIPVDAVELVGGLEYRFMSFNGDKIESFQLNIPGLFLGIRARL